MIRPPFRPPLTHHSDKPVTPTDTTATEPAGKTCCGRPGCCGSKPKHGEHEHSQDNPGLNSGNGDRHGATPGHTGESGSSGRA